MIGRTRIQIVFQSVSGRRTSDQKDPHTGHCTALETAGRTDADQVTHEQPQVEAASVDQHTFQNVRVSAQVHAAQAASFVEMRERTFESFATQAQQPLATSAVNASPVPIDGVGARMRAGLRASNRRARHLPMRYETGLPSSVIRFRTLHASTASRRCPDELRARRQSPTIDVYRKNAFSTRAC